MSSGSPTAGWLIAQLRASLQQVAAHLSGRRTGLGNAPAILDLPTVRDACGELLTDLAAIEHALTETAPMTSLSGGERTALLSLAIRIVHLGGAEFYSAPRVGNIFDALLGVEE